MTEVSPVGQTSPSTVNGPAKTGPILPTAASQNRGQDQVELSDLARLKSKLREMPPIREDLVQRVQQQIADGTYSTDERIDAAIKNLLQDLG